MKQQQQQADMMSSSSPKKKNEKQLQQQQQKIRRGGGSTIRLSLTTLVATLLVASGLAFFMGRWTRWLILDGSSAAHFYHHHVFGQQQFSSSRVDGGKGKESRQSKEKQKTFFSFDLLWDSTTTNHSAEKNVKNTATAMLDGNPVDDDACNAMNGSSIVESSSRHPNHPRFSRPSRYEMLHSLDSRQEESSLYHQTLVHPAMLTHRNTRRVAIIIIDDSSSRSMNETSSVHEVLKHNTLEQLTVIRHVGDNENGTNRGDASAYYLDDDDRVEFVTENAVDWFTRHYSNNSNDTKKLDVIIIDSFSKGHHHRHHHHASSPSTLLFANNENNSMTFAKALVGNALTDQGILVAHVGPADQPRDAALTYNPQRHERLELTRALEELGELGVLESIKIYSSESSSSMRPTATGTARSWTFLVAFRNYTTLTRWFANQAEIDLELDARIVEPFLPLQHFDGATMETYQYPSRITEDVFCRTTTDPDLCDDNGHGFDPQVPNAPISSFEVKPSQIQGAGRGVYLTESVQQGTYIAIDQGVHSLFVLPSAHKLITDMEDKTDGALGDLWKPPLFYMHGYGFETEYFGTEATVVDPGILTFANHGCNNTYNMGKVLSVTEMTADKYQPPSEVLLEDWGGTIFDPFHDRSHWIYESGSDQFRVDVQAGTELLDNYLPFYADWEEGVSDLRSQCEGQTVGLVTAYEAADAEP